MVGKFKCSKCGKETFLITSASHNHQRYATAILVNGDIEDYSDIKKDSGETNWNDVICCLNCNAEYSRRVMAGDSPLDYDKILGLARHTYKSRYRKNIEIYSDAKINRSGDDGFWVEAYVWVPNPDQEE